MSSSWEVSSGISPVTCRSDPVVFLNILDHYSRRNENQVGVIGTLLGTTLPGGVTEVTNCFPVPHTITDRQPRIEMEYYKTMIDLHRKVNPNEVIVGWYACSPEPVGEYDVIFHAFFGKHTHPCIHVVVNPTLEPTAEFAMKAYVTSPVQINGVDFGTQFHEVKLVKNIGSTSESKVAIDTLLKATSSTDDQALTKPMGNDVAQLEVSMQRLKQMLDIVSTYVTQVLRDETPADKQLGRQLMDTLSVMPKISAEALTESFNAGLQDLLMVVSLSNITKAQLLIAERLRNLTA